MKIQEIIDVIKENSFGSWQGKKIEPQTTRDQILYGNPNQECTGIIVSLFASVDVIKQAKQKGANFIIVHEALFWNHGDHTEWLKDNKTYQNKIELLGDICVWRDHDYIHSGIKIGDDYRDGIFTGLMKIMGWEDNLVNSYQAPRQFHFDNKPVRELCAEIMDKMHVTGIKYMGDIDGVCNNLYIPMHIIGNDDNNELKYIEENNIDTILAMEITDFTLSEYIRDSAMEGIDKRVLAVGHFNVEEPGMDFFADYLKDLLPKNIAIEFVRSGEAFSFITK